MYSDLSWSRVRGVNVDGTREIFEGARLAGLRRGVHLSSVAVYGDPVGTIDEESQVDTPLRPKEKYARSKREAEVAVREIAGKAGMAIGILRPSAIYGERDRLFTPRLVRNLRAPLHFLLGNGRTPLPLVYAGNLAQAIFDALRGELPEGARAFNVASDFSVTQRELLKALAEALGVSFRPTPLPRRLVLVGARLGESLGARIPDAEELSLTRAARLALYPNPFVSERIRKELGWAPQFSKEEAIARTARWVQEEAGAKGSRILEG
jgi:nucleoside-diphosphate-sugar epimerase